MKHLREHWRELALAGCFLLPPAILLGLGFAWLLEHRAALAWVGFAAACGLGAMLLLRRLGVGRAAAPAPAPPDAAWGPQDLAAWARVQAIVAATPAFEFDDPGPARMAVQGVADEVARRYGPDSVEPLAHFTLPEALLLIERTSRRLRAELLRALPFSHAVRVSTVLWWWNRRRLLDLAGQAWDFWRLLRPVADPIGAVLNELRGHALREASGYTSARLRQILTRLVLEEAGRAAIDLYSGRLRIDEQRLAAALGAGPAAEAAVAPLRILVAGQVNAGKSRLLNALAGEVRAAATPLPAPAGGAAVELALEGKPAIRLIEAPGLRADGAGIDALLAGADRADAILWVAAANTAARDPDVRALTALRAAQARDPALNPPPLLLVVSHIDRLPPFAEWAPPYDIVRPVSLKARRIGAAVNAIRDDLGVSGTEAVPVCLDPGQGLYNLDLVWNLLAARLPEARTRQLQRALRAARHGIEPLRALRQAAEAGRALLSG